MKVLPVILLFLFFQIVHENHIADSYLKQGVYLEHQGKPEQALQLWQQAIGVLEVPSVVIATEYLRMATQYKLRDYFPSASDYYMWGMSGSDSTDVKLNIKALEDELARLEPLLDQRKFKKWHTLLEENNPIIFEEIRQFWVRLNIRPSTDYNERLIEHWSRIAYAREHFVRSNEPPFGTDERGWYYVKYGEPDRIDSGRVDVTRDKIQWILDQLRPPPPPNLDNFDPPHGNFDLMITSNRISNLFLNPNYELWIYNSPADQMSHNLVLIFGHRSGGSFGRLQVLEDFMPISAFDVSVLLRSDYNPALPPVPVGMVLQMIYYEHFFSKDPYFAQLYSGLTAELFRGNRETWPQAHLAGNLRQRNINQTSRIRSQAPAEFSTEEKKLPEMPMQVYQYRMLDENNRPVFATFVESSPHQAFLIDFTLNKEVMTATSNDESTGGGDEIFNWYRVTHGLQLRDAQWELLGRTQKAAPLILDPIGDLYSHSVMIIPWTESSVTQVFYAELMNNHPESRPFTESLFSNSLRGLGKLEIEQPEPLPYMEGELTAADIIFGYWKVEGQLGDDILFNFTPANNRQIPEGENFVIHFEVYQLQKDQDGISRFEVEYRIRPESRSLRRTRTQTDRFRVTLSFEHDRDRFTESLEIETVSIETGKYELEWIIRDVHSGQSHEQKMSFEVVESGS